MSRTITVYTLAELKAQFPKAYERAYERWKAQDHDIPWQKETMDSLKAVIAAAGAELRDWSIGPWVNSYVVIRFASDEVANFTGRRAFAWLEAHVFGPLREPWRPFTDPRRRKLAEYNLAYRSCHPPGKRTFYEPGRVNPCPFSGYVADEVYLDALVKSVREGRRLGLALTDLADEARKMMEDDVEQAENEESFEANNETSEYLESGTEV